MSIIQSHQQVTPELRQWIVSQAAAGHSAESVLQAMKASGWNEDVAVEAMESTLRGHLESQAVASGLGYEEMGAVSDVCLVAYPIGVVQFDTISQPSAIGPTYAGEVRLMAERAVFRP